MIYTFEYNFIIVVSSSSSQVDSLDVNHGPWAEALEAWVTNFSSNNSRTARAMKVGDKTVTVSTKISTTNKRDVSETDLYLLSTIYKKASSTFLIIIIVYAINK